jgi:hypothetical protein
MPRPAPSDYPAFFDTYVRLVPEQDLVVALENSCGELERDLGRITNEKQDHAYGPMKWTMRQLLQHAIDTERIFAYRALCIARGENQPLPGFDENGYAERAEVRHRPLWDMKEEFLGLRKTTTALFKGFTQEMLASSGISDGKTIGVLAIGFMVIGHWRHHDAILRERYGV